MVLVVVEQVFPVAVVEVEHNELIVLLTDAETDIQNRVEIKVPSLTLDQGHVGHPTLVCRKALQSCLINTAILKDVLILLPVDDGNPCLGVNHKLGVDNNRSAERNLVPTEYVRTAVGIWADSSPQIEIDQPMERNRP